MDIYTPIILEYKISTLDSIQSLAQFNFLSFYNHVLFILYNLGGETWKKNESQIKLIFFLVQVKIYWCLAFSRFSLSLFQCTNDFFTYIKCIFIGLIKYFTYSTIISLDSNISYLTNTERENVDSRCPYSISLFFSFPSCVYRVISRHHEKINKFHLDCLKHE